MNAKTTARDVFWATTSIVAFIVVVTITLYLTTLLLHNLVF